MKQNTQNKIQESIVPSIQQLSYRQELQNKLLQLQQSENFQQIKNSTKKTQDDEEGLSKKVQDLICENRKLEDIFNQDYVQENQQVSLKRKSNNKEDFYNDYNLQISLTNNSINNEFSESLNINTESLSDKFNNMRNLLENSCKKPNQQSRTIYITPERVIQLSNIYILKDSQVINEVFMKELCQFEQQFEFNSDSSNSQEDINFLSENLRQCNIDEQVKDISNIINNYKYIDYMLHENKNKKKHEFVLCKLASHPNVTLYQQQYLIERFKSFGNTFFKKKADMIQEQEDLYNTFVKNIYPKLKLEEEQILKQQGGFLNYLTNSIKKIMDKYGKYPMIINQYRLGENNSLLDGQNYTFSKKFLDLQGYNSVDEVIVQNMKRKQIQKHLQINNYIIFNQLHSNKLQIYDTLYLNREKTRQIQKGAFQIIKKNGDLLEFEGKSVSIRKGLNLFMNIVVEKVYDQDDNLIMDYTKVKGKKNKKQNEGEEVDSNSSNDEKQNVEQNFEIIVKNEFDQNQQMEQE